MGGGTSPSAKCRPRKRTEVKRVPCKGSALRLWGSAKVRTYGPSSLIWKCDKGKTPLEASEHSRPPSWILSSARWGRGRRHKEASRGKGSKEEGQRTQGASPVGFAFEFGKPLGSSLPPLGTVPNKGFASQGSRCQKHKGATLATDVVRTSAVY